MPTDDRPKIEQVLDGLHGNRETFRAILDDKDQLLAKACQYATYRSKQTKVPAWLVIGAIFGHGSGVSAAIYELYRDPKDGEPHDV